MVSYLASVRKQFAYYKILGEGAIAQLSESELLTTDYAKEGSEQINSIAVIVKHLVGNMKSRWTNVFSEDGEKSWRDRDDEFIASYHSSKQMMDAWETAWSLLFAVLNDVTTADVEREIYIRNMGHTLTEAINRQMMHYAYHVGQIVHIAKMYKGDEWQSLSIPLNESSSYNSEKFSKEKSRTHFTNEWIGKKN